MRRILDTDTVEEEEVLWSSRDMKNQVSVIIIPRGFPDIFHFPVYLELSLQIYAKYHKQGILVLSLWGRCTRYFGIFIDYGFIQN